MRILSVFLCVVGVAVCLTAGGRLGVQHNVHLWQKFQKDDSADMGMGMGMSAHMPMGVTAMEHERFVLDVLLQVHKPLMHEGFIAWAKKFHGDASMYKEPHDDWLQWFLSHAAANDFVGPEHTFNAWNMDHAHFMMGFYKFLVLAKDWEMFMHNVCFGRMHLNPVVFVSGLYWAVHDRDDTHDIVLPAMYEVLPAMFFDDEVIKMAEETEWPHLVGPTQTQKPKLWDMMGMRGGWGNSAMSSSASMMMPHSKFWQWWQSYMGHKMMPMESYMSDEHKLIIPVGSDEHPMQITDDMGMNVFWHHMMMERLMHKMSSMSMHSMGETMKSSMHMMPMEKMDNMMYRMPMDKMMYPKSMEKMEMKMPMKKHMYPMPMEKMDPMNKMYPMEMEKMGPMNKMYPMEMEKMGPMNKMYPMEMEKMGPMNKMYPMQMEKMGPMSKMHPMEMGKMGPMSKIHHSEMEKMGPMSKMHHIEMDKMEAMPKEKFSHHETMDNKMPAWWMRRGGGVGSGYSKPIDDLPTTSVHSDKLVHVNHRWHKHDMSTSKPHHGYDDVDGSWPMPHWNMDDKQSMSQPWHYKPMMHDDSEKHWQREMPPSWWWQQHMPMDHEHEHSGRVRRSFMDAVHHHAGMTTEELKYERGGEMFMHNMQQMVARMHFDKVAMMSMMGGSSGSPSWWWWPQQSKHAYTVFHSAVQHVVADFKSMVDAMLEHQHIDWQHGERVMHVIGDMLMGHNAEHPHVWEMMHAQMWHVMQSVVGMSASHSTMANLHEPVEQLLLEELVHLFAYYEHQMPPYTADDWRMPDVHVQDVHFEPFVTYTEPHDTVLINMVDQQLLQSHSNNMAFVQQSVVARQQRLNHQPFAMTFKISSEHSQHVVMRVMMAPKMDHMGHAMTMMEMRHHFVVLDAFDYMLKPGDNVVYRHSRDISWTTRDFTTLTELYKHLFTDDSWHHDSFVGCNCHFPHRMLMPRGTAAGLPVQMFVIVTPVDSSMAGWHIDMDYMCGMGISSMMWDHLPFNYPFDREVGSEMHFYVPNIFMMDSVIYHHEKSMSY